MPRWHGLSRCGLVSLFAVVVMPSVSFAQGIAFTFTQLDAQNWEVTAVVTGDTANTAGFAGYAFRIIRGDFNQMSWTQDAGLLGLDDSFQPFGFDVVVQGVVGNDEEFTFGGIISAGGGNFVPGIGLTPISIAGCCGGDSDIDIGFPAVLGVLTVGDGTILTSADFFLDGFDGSLYTADAEAPINSKDFIQDDFPISITTIPIPEPTSLLLLTVPALFLRRRDRVICDRDRS